MTYPTFTDVSDLICILEYRVRDRVTSVDICAVKCLHHPPQPLLHIRPWLRKHHPKPPRLLARERLSVRNEHLLRHQSRHDSFRQLLPLFTSFLCRGDGGKEEGFQIDPEEEGGVDVWGVGDVVAFEEGDGEGVVFGQAVLVGADVGFCVGGVGEEGGGYVVGDRGRVRRETAMCQCDVEGRKR